MLSLLHSAPEVIMPLVLNYQALFLTCREAYMFSIRESLPLGKCWYYTNVQLLIPPPYNENLNKTELLIVVNRTCEEYVFINPRWLMLLYSLKGRWRSNDKIVIYPGVMESDIVRYGVREYGYAEIERHVNDKHYIVCGRLIGNLQRLCEKYGISTRGKKDRQLVHECEAFMRYGAK